MAKLDLTRSARRPDMGEYELVQELLYQRGDPAADPGLMKVWSPLP